MAWIKKYWDSPDGFLEHDKKKYAIPVRRFQEGTADGDDDWPYHKTWFLHLSEKRWITYGDLLELKTIFKSQYPNVNWDYFLECALKVNPKSTN